MREIKFRAWYSSDTKEMMLHEDYPGQVFKWFSENQPLEIMQYTGLKDKNGTEIYEGDLLRHPARDSWEQKNFVAFEVFFHDNDRADRHIGFQMNRLHFQGSIGGYSMVENFLPRYTEKMEIIGNIYENPELLRRLNNERN